MEQESLWILLGKKLAGVATEEELRELELLLLAYGEDAGTMEIIERMWLSRRQRPVSDEDAIRDQIDEAIQRMEETAPPEKRSRPARRWILSGIGVCVAAVLCFVIFRKPPEEGKGETMNVIFTRRKSHSNLQFPDGTTVVLNENSRISYNADFGKTRREIILEGEAYFNVVKNAGIPLIIHVRNVDIKVLGTAFNVKAYPKDRNVETSLIGGKVEVSLRKYPERPILLKPNEKIDIPDETDAGTGAALEKQPAPSNADRLKTSQQPEQDNAGLSDTLSYQLQPLKIEKTSRLIPEIAWMYRKLVFNHEAFESVVEKMERWYDVQVYFEDDELKKEVFTGSFEKESLEEALKALQFSYPFDFTIKKKEIFIKRK